MQSTKSVKIMNKLLEIMKLLYFFNLYIFTMSNRLTDLVNYILDAYWYG